jgi:hypothetical protein
MNLKTNTSLIKMVYGKQKQGLISARFALVVFRWQ